MNILVTGAEGMVGSDLCLVLRRGGHQVIRTDLRPRSPETLALDIVEAAQVQQVVEAACPDVVIHLAAETDVDRCEQDPPHAYRTNAAGTEHIVRSCERIGARLLYMSTAAVFDGTKLTPYVETDLPDPVNVYGRSKLAGEVAVQRLRGHYQIVRAGWMVGGLERDKKFVWKILTQLMEGRRELQAVTDKVGTLTFTADLSRGIAALIDTNHRGIFHMANHGACSRYDIVCKLVEWLDRRDVVVRPVTSSAFPLPAPRSASEALENARLQSLGLDQMPSWDTALRAYVQRYLETYNIAQAP